MPPPKLEQCKCIEKKKRKPNLDDRGIEIIKGFKMQVREPPGKRYMAMNIFNYSCIPMGYQLMQYNDRLGYETGEHLMDLQDVWNVLTMFRHYNFILLRAILKCLTFDCITTEAILVAGSFVLSSWQFLTKHDGSLIPKNYDVFLRGCREMYLTLLNGLQDYLNTVNATYVMHNKTTQYSTFGMCKEATEFVVEGLLLPILIIWCPEAATDEDVIKSFDLSCCQIGYNILKDKWVIEKDVVEQLKRYETRITREFHFSGIVPDQSESANLMAAFTRARKYQERGYKVVNAPSITYGCNN